MPDRSELVGHLQSIADGIDHRREKLMADPPAGVPPHLQRVGLLALQDDARAVREAARIIEEES